MAKRPEPSFLSKIDGQRILVSGGTGFIGKSLLDYLTALKSTHRLDIKVSVLSRKPEKFQHAFPQYAQNWIETHLHEVRKMPESMGHFDSFIHLANPSHPSERKKAELHGNESLNLDLEASITEGSKAALEYSKLSGVSRFLLVSSGAVYGPQPAKMEKMSEDFFGQQDPLPGYGRAKKHSEAIALSFAKHFSVKIARCFALVGPHLPLDSGYAMTDFIREALAGRPLLIQGHPQTQRSYLESQDLAQWLLEILFADSSEQIYNVGSDHKISIEELARMVTSLVSPHSNLKLIQKSEVMTELAGKYIPDIERAKGLGLDVWTSLEDAILRAANFHRGIQ